MIALLLLVVVVLAVAAGFALAVPRLRTARLRRRFAGEYDRALLHHDGEVSAAENELTDRLHRHRTLRLQALSAAEREQVVDAFRGLQVRFVDDPLRAVKVADQMLGELLDRVGYPGQGRQAALSVDHAPLLAPYRLALGTLERARTTGAGTEELRGALLALREMALDVAGRDPVATTERTAARRLTDRRPGRRVTTADRPGGA
ncbi:hypothetical protein OG455_01615 [Kitasatospora sp. NBC_01287]|uniref:hypothetical protein n=1 Tax=Kitasatospora sp. NBC_01287 TaxID=2903573 RepID=UPI00225C39DA|nr:hypothetical protein [Kitasatospora sp. NBC_01287]MCX4744223.1 hypothetical protein [Kitasatospora sp. NBC_01287]